MHECNRLTRISKEPFDKESNSAHIKYLALLVLALYKVQTVNLQKMATAFKSKAKKNSSLRRIRRFLAHAPSRHECIAEFIFSLLPIRLPFYLLSDRTNWKAAGKEIDILMLSIAYKKVSFPILFSLLPRGSSSKQGRIRLLQRYIELFGKRSIPALMADREFWGEAWLNFLDHENIHYLIRIKDSSASIGYLDRERVKVKELFRCLDINQRMAIATPFIIDGNKCYLIPLCFLNDKEIRDLVAVISFKYEPQAISLYSKRR